MSEATVGTRSPNAEPGPVIDDTPLFASEVGKAVVDSVPLIAVNRGGLIVYANHWAERMFLYPLRGLKSKRLNTLIPADVGSVHDRHLDEFFANPHPRIMRPSVQGVKHDGTRFTLSILLIGIQFEGMDYAVAVLHEPTPRG